MIYIIVVVVVIIVVIFTIIIVIIVVIIFRTLLYFFSYFFNTFSVLFPFFPLFFAKSKNVILRNQKLKKNLLAGAIQREHFMLQC